METTKKPPRILPNLSAWTPSREAPAAQQPPEPPKQQRPRKQEQGPIQEKEPTNPKLDAPVLTLDENRKKATEFLADYLSGENKMVREHQKNALENLFDFLDDGNTAGYISHVGGSGKTHIISEMAKALDGSGIKIVILSPTQLILSQTGDKIRSTAEDVEIANYYAGEKGDLSSTVINTTPHSFMRLLDKGAINPEQIGLVLVDEGQAFLGEQRHTIFGKLPNALKIGLTATPYFAPIEGFIERGIVDENEPWVDLFSKCIHELGLEEAIEKDIIAPLKVVTIGTDVNVDNIAIQKGDYNRVDLERQLDVEVRNNLTIAAIVGPDNLIGARFSNEQLIALRELHDEIKGKKTAVFGLSIEHVEKLAEQLRDYGITAATIHHGVPKEARDRILKRHESGEIAVLLGIDMLRVGWDSPATSVGVMAQPTYSGIVAEQRLARILRKHESKEFGIAIDFVDNFRRHPPILVSDIFDPYYVLKGSQTGSKPWEGDLGSPSVRPKVIFSGMNISAVIEEARGKELLERALKGDSSIIDASKAIEKIIFNKTKADPKISVEEIYETVMESMPFRVSMSKQLAALNAAQGSDTEAARAGRNLLVYLNLRGIMLGIRDYLEDAAPEERPEIIQEGIASVLSRGGDLHSNYYLSLQIPRMARSGVERFIAEREGIPMGWVGMGIYSSVKEAVSKFASGREGISEKKFEEALDEIMKGLDIKDTGETERLRLRLSRYLAYKLYGLPREVSQEYAEHEEGEVPINIVHTTEQRRILTRAMTRNLSPIEERVLRLRYGIGEPTLEEIARPLGLSAASISRIEKVGLQILRRPSSLPAFNPKVNEHALYETQKAERIVYQESIGLLFVPFHDLDIFRSKFNENIARLDQEVYARVMENYEKIRYKIVAALAYMHRPTGDDALTVYNLIEAGDLILNKPRLGSYRMDSIWRRDQFYGQLGINNLKTNLYFVIERYSQNTGNTPESEDYKQAIRMYEEALRIVRQRDRIYKQLMLQTAILNVQRLANFDNAEIESRADEIEKIEIEKLFASIEPPPEIRDIRNILRDNMKRE